MTTKALQIAQRSLVALCFTFGTLQASHKSMPTVHTTEKSPKPSRHEEFEKSKAEFIRHLRMRAPKLAERDIAEIANIAQELRQAYYDHPGSRPTTGP